ncbi:hypothetical protein NDU88_004626 [Pleurodeles waltl]|uniref:Receptor ligand binding region domain-containing protein n=1 Tax=Pleurodeles waltl TaxID=8319 RepID=A0AAV7L1I3_PLEWA|nr:hypothetical protein NDU88_004626 [Pleurodeles waltl]
MSSRTLRWDYSGIGLADTPTVGNQGPANDNNETDLGASAGGIGNSGNTHAMGTEAGILQSIYSSIKELQTETRIESRRARVATKRLQGSVRKVAKSCMEIEAKLCSMEDRIVAVEEDMDTLKEQNTARDGQLTDVIEVIPQAAEQEYLNYGPFFMFAFLFSSGRLSAEEAKRRKGSSKPRDNETDVRSTVEQKRYFRHVPLQKAYGGMFRAPLYQRLLAMVFAIEEINQNPVLLPDATLGFWMYDSCGVVGRTLRSALWMITGREKIIPLYRCQKTPPLAAIIGDAASLASIPMARLLGLHRQPQISYGSTVSLLSDKQQFPSFLRTVPSDEYQSRVLADLIAHFGWTWVGIVAEESDYGQLGSQILKEELGRYSACAAFHVGLPVVYSERKMNHVINVIKESRAKVVVSFSSMDSMLPLLKEAARLNLTGKVWIASEGWAGFEQFSDTEFSKVLNGSLRLLIQKSLLPGFRNFMLGIQPSHTSSDIFMRSFWAEVFDCQWPTNETKRISTDLKHCYGTEELTGLNKTFLDETKFNNAATAHKAVYAVAHALHNLRACRDGEGPFQNNSCADRIHFESWQVRIWVLSKQALQCDTALSRLEELPQ